MVEPKSENKDLKIGWLELGSQVKTKDDVSRSPEVQLESTRPEVPLSSIDSDSESYVALGGRKGSD